MYKRLFLFVEGPDDARFFERVINPLLGSQFETVQTVQYGGMAKQKLQSLLSSIRKMGAQYLFVADRDMNPCITTKKEKIVTALPGLDPSRILVVVPEIESWYVAGLTSVTAKSLRMQSIADITSITKERFNHLIPSRFDSRTDFMMEILRVFDFDEARKRSGSLEYLVTKHGLSA